MKIVIMVEEFDQNKGYLEYYLARELAKLGHEIFVFAFSKAKKISRVRMTEEFEVITFPYVALLNGQHIPTLVGLFSAIRFVKNEKPDIIHCQPLHSILPIVLISSRRLFGYKIVGTVFSQNPSLNNQFKKLLFNLLKFAVKLYIKNGSDIIFVKSDEMMKAQRQLFSISPNKFRVIPLGADPCLFKFSREARGHIRSSLGLSDNNIIVIYSGRVIPSKRLDVLAKAIAPIVRENENTYLLIVGDGEPSYMKYLKKLVEDLKISKKIIFHPCVHRTKLPEFYSASDIAVWPGLSSISIVEAISVGLPVIIEDSPVEIYAIEYENGFAFEPGNVDELRDHLEKLVYDSKLRKNMSDKSRLLVKQKLSWRTIALQYLNAYKCTLHPKVVMKGKKENSDDK